MRRKLHRDKVTSPRHLMVIWIWGLPRGRAEQHGCRDDHDSRAWRVPQPVGSTYPDSWHEASHSFIPPDSFPQRSKSLVTVVLIRQPRSVMPVQVGLFPIARIYYL